MIPKGLKVGDSFNDEGVAYKVTKVIGDRYESVWVGATSPKPLVVDNLQKVVEKAEENKAEITDVETDYLSMPYAQLKKLCADRGLDATGKKADLIARLEG